MTLWCNSMYTFHKQCHSAVFSNLVYGLVFSAKVAAKIAYFAIGYNIFYMNLALDLSRSLESASASCTLRDNSLLSLFVFCAALNFLISLS